jgi:seryl-tRNA synthetase
MIDPKLLRENPDAVRAGMRRKQMDPAMLDALIELDVKRSELRRTTEASQAELNVASQEMAQATPEKREELRGQLRELSDGIKANNTQLSELDEQWLVLMRQVPNLPASDVPEGTSDKENVVLRTEGTKPEFSFQPKDHEELAIALDLLDMDRATKVAGSKFYYLKNELVILELAVLRFAIDTLRSKGFTLLSVPHMAKAEAMYGASHFVTPEDATTGDAYQLERDELYLTGTAEVALVNYRANEIMHESELPARYIGISPCYRREAGTYGKEARGLYRVHQFNKVEMVCLTRPQDSEDEHKMLLDLAEDLLKKLGLHYQVVFNCGGDLGQPQYKKWDIETWMPGLGKFGETQSCSNDTDYQARSLNIRYRRSGEGGEKEITFVHTLNNTALASPRILVAILENYQQEDGSIKIPEVLLPYTGFSEIRRHD